MLLSLEHRAQAVPSENENIEALVIFGSNSDHAWGDDDFSQTIFFAIPKGYTQPFYIRIYDPETFGELDAQIKGWNTKMKYMVYGGKDAYYEKDARGVNPVGKYKSGELIQTKIFGSEATTDQKWISLGPFTTKQGEYVKEQAAFVFKFIVEGINGDDANLYRLFLSSKAEENASIAGALAFAYEYSVRLPQAIKSVSHLYPIADSNMKMLKVNSFDFGEDGQAKLYSKVKNGHLVKMSKDNEWCLSAHFIKEEEKGKCLDLQIFKTSEDKNNFVISFRNEMDVAIPFFMIPPDGMPRYVYKIYYYKKVQAKKE